MKKILVALAIILGGGLLLSQMSGQADTGPKRIGIKAPDGTKHYVPQEVVDAKDCEAYRTWRDELTQPGFVPAVHPCPWDKPYDGEMGTYIVNGVAFEVPKEALLVDQKEGEVKGVTLLLKWPELTAAKWEGDQSKVIKIGIEKNNDLTGKIVGLEGKVDTARMLFHSAASWKSIKNGRSTIVDPNPVFLGHIENYNLDYYKLPRLGEYVIVNHDFFIKGDPLDPDIWYKCRLITCETIFKLSDKIYVKLFHHRDPFLSHDINPKLRSMVTKKIKSFIVAKSGEKHGA